MCVAIHPTRSHCAVEEQQPLLWSDDICEGSTILYAYLAFRAHPKCTSLTPRRPARQGEHKQNTPCTTKKAITGSEDTPHLLQVVCEKMLDVTGLACANDDALLVGVLIDHILADTLAHIARKLHQQLPFIRAITGGLLSRLRRRRLLLPGPFTTMQKKKRKMLRQNQPRRIRRHSCYLPGMPHAELYICTYGMSFLGILCNIS